LLTKNYINIKENFSTSIVFKRRNFYHLRRYVSAYGEHFELKIRKINQITNDGNDAPLSIFEPTLCAVHLYMSMVQVQQNGGGGGFVAAQ
jgi:hypothetical protein